MTRKHDSGHASLCGKTCAGQPVQRLSVPRGRKEEAIRTCGDHSLGCFAYLLHCLEELILLNLIIEGKYNARVVHVSLSLFAFTS